MRPHLGRRFGFVIQWRKTQSVFVNETGRSTMANRNNGDNFSQPGENVECLAQPRFDAADIQCRIEVALDPLIAVIASLDQPPFGRPHRHFCERFPNIQDNDTAMSHGPHPVYFDRWWSNMIEPVKAPASFSAIAVALSRLIRVLC